MSRGSPTRWDLFKASPSPLTTVREIKGALGQHGPGLSAMYAEAKQDGTVLGAPVLSRGRAIFVSRQLVIDKIEGGRGGSSAT
jgi:hypothetical protein